MIEPTTTDQCGQDIGTGGKDFVLYTDLSYLLSQTLTSINSLLERADSVYKLLVKHRNDLDQLLTSLAGGVVTSRSVR